MAKMYEVTISGNYKTATKDIIEFQNVKGLMPFCEDEIADMHCRARYASKWVKDTMKDGEPAYPDRINKMREVFIDDKKVVETKGELSFVGKDIKELNMDQLQDLATAKDLRLIPVPKLGDLRNSRVLAYVAYSDKILGKEIKHQLEGFNFFKLPSVLLDGESRSEGAQKITNEEIIEAEMKSTSTSDDPRARFTLDELKKLAAEKKVSYHPSIGFDALYSKLYGTVA